MSEVLKISDDHFIEYKFDLIKSLFGLYYNQSLDEISVEKSISVIGRLLVTDEDEAWVPDTITV